MTEDVDGCSSRVLCRARSVGERRDVSIGSDEVEDGGGRGVREGGLVSEPRDCFSDWSLGEMLVWFGNDQRWE